MKVEVLTPKKIEFQEEAESIVLPTYLGQISVLSHHAPLISVLKPGRIKIRTKKGEILKEIEGGILEVTKDKITILLKKF